MMRVTLTLAAVVTLVAFVQGHGYLANPPQRNSAWRAGFNTPNDTNDMDNYCGGREVQHEQNGGKCGVCGEEFNNPNKTLEPGPANQYATGTIFANYKQGETIDVTVQITEFNQGYYEFRLCENDVPQKGMDASVAVTKECLDKNLLKSPAGETKFPASTGKSTHKVVLAPDVYCTACVIQWRYRTGSGMGPQEEFVGCSDIAITPWGETVPTTEKPTEMPTTAKSIIEKTTTDELTTAKPTTAKPTTAKPTTAKPTTAKPTTAKPTTAKPTTAKPTTAKPTTAKPTTAKPTTAKPTTAKPTTAKPTTAKPTTAKPTTAKPTTAKPTTAKPTTAEPTTVKPTTALPETSATTEKTTPKPTTTQAPITQAPTTQKPTPKPAPVTKPSTTMKLITTQKATIRPRPQVNSGRKQCKGQGPWSGTQFDVWCDSNCNHFPPHCPSSHCACN